MIQDFCTSPTFPVLICVYLMVIVISDYYSLLHTRPIIDHFFVRIFLGDSQDRGKESAYFSYFSKETSNNSHHDRRLRNIWW